MSVTYAPTIDARGADSSAVARLEQLMQRQAAEFESNVVSAVRSAKKRRVQF